MAEQKAQLNYIHMAPRKVRLLADTMRGLTAGEAEAQLMLSPRRAKDPLLKVLRSAIANAKNNQKIETDDLFVSEIRVNQGPMLKRFLPRAMGRATPIHKKMSHVSITLADRPGAKNRFVIAPPKKKEEKKPKKRTATPKPDAPKKEEFKKKTPGFFQKVFRRKSI